MKKLVIATIVAAAVSPAAFANPALAEKKNCLACHPTDKKLVGPSYKDVAAKYAGQKDAAAKLAEKIQRVAPACGARSRCRPTRRSTPPRPRRWRPGS